jgi:hypothetical protein
MADPRSPRATAQAVLGIVGGYPTPLAIPATGPTVVDGAVGVVTVGTHRWAVTFTKAGSESALGPFTSFTSAGTVHCSLTAVPLGPTGTTGRNVYKTIAGGTTDYRLIGAIADNTTTTFDDNLADATLNANAPAPVSGQPEADTYQEHGRRALTDGGL